MRSKEAIPYPLHDTQVVIVLFPVVVLSSQTFQVVRLRFWFPSSHNYVLRRSPINRARAATPAAINTPPTMGVNGIVFVSSC